MGRELRARVCKQSAAGDAVEDFRRELQLVDFDELVGGVGLGDRAGAEDDGRHAGGREGGRIGAEGHADQLAAAARLLAPALPRVRRAAGCACRSGRCFA